MDPFKTLAEFGVGLIKERHLQEWARLIASLSVSAFVTFVGTFGLSLEAQLHLSVPASVAIPLSLAHSCVLMALSVLNLWTKSPATKGIPILFTGKIEVARIEQLTGDSIIFNPNEKR